mgnify:CR=1 FL=1
MCEIGNKQLTFSSKFWYLEAGGGHMMRMRFHYIVLLREGDLLVGQSCFVVCGVVVLF